MINELLTRRTFLRSLTVLGASVLLPSLADAQAARVCPCWQGFGVCHARSHTYHSAGPDQCIVSMHCRLSARTKAAWSPGIKARSRSSARVTAAGLIVAGRNISGPPPSPLHTLPIRVVKGMVMVAA